MVWYYGKTSNGGLVGADHLVTVEHNKLPGAIQGPSDTVESPGDKSGYSFIQ